MVIARPFFKWISDDSSCHHHRHGTHYYLIPTQGERVFAAISIRRRSGGLYYKAHSSFKQNYGNDLHIGQNLVWYHRDDLALWLRAMMHNSFICCSIPDVGRCWFEKQLWEHDCSNYMIVPRGLEAYLHTMGRSIWVLLRHGSEAWPIKVTNARFQFGWDTFWPKHDLGYNYQLIFSCQRQWVFDVTILDPQGNVVVYDWSFTENPFWWDPAPEPTLVTACLPVLMKNNTPLRRMGVPFLGEENYLQEFQRIVDPLWEHFHMDHIDIKMGSRTWTILVDETTSLDAATFYNFMSNLHFEPFNYTLVAVMANLDIRVNLFDPEADCERLYEWL